MAFGGTGTDNIEIRVVVDASGAIKLLDQTGKAVGQLEQAALKGDKGISKLQGSIIALDSALSIATRGFRALQGVAGATFGAMEQASKIEGLNAAFMRLQASVGVLAVDKLPALRAATGGLISDLDLMQQANNAVLLGVDKGTGSYEKAAAQVVKLGRAMGIDAVKALESFTIGTARQSKLWLDNLGIIVQVEQAHKKYAAQVGRDVGALSEEEKQLAFTQAAFEAVEVSAAKLGATQETAATAATRATVAWANLKAEILTNISSSQEAAQAFNQLAAQLNSIDAGAIASGFTLIAGTILEIGKMAAETGEAIGALIQRLQQVAQFKQQGPTDTLGAVLQHMPFAGPAAAQLWDYMTKGADQAVQSVQKVAQSMTTASTATDKQRQAQQKLVEQFRATAPAQKAVTTQSDEAQKKAEELTKQYDKLQQQIQETMGAGGISTLAQKIADVRIAEQQGILTNEQATDALRKMSVEVKSSADGMQDWGAALQDSNGIVNDWKQSIKEAAEEDLRKFEQALDDSRQGLADLFSQMGMMPEMSELMSESLANMFPQTMASAGSWMPYISMAIQVGEGMMDSYARDKKVGWKTGQEIAQNMYKSAYTSLFGQNLGSLFYKIDKFFFGWAHNSISRMVGGMFGHTNAGELMREGFNNLFEEAFEKLPHGQLKLWIEDELKTLDGIEVGNYESDILSKIDSASAGGFLGIGTAFEEMIEQMGHDAEGFAGQFATILADNVGGSLNNLQMMFQALEVSAEDLLAAIENAYLAGDISAGQFLQSSQQINDLYTQGIPGAIGATDQAIRNFGEGALTSGRIAKDALGDMAAELKEKNPAATLEDMRKELIAAGVSAEDTNKIMSEFGKAGIKNLDDLMAISTEQTAQIVDNLEKQGYAFDKPIEKADELIKRLEELEGKHVTTYVDIVETTIHREENQTMARGGILHAAAGRILNSATMVRSNVLAGEAGPEAVLPLARGADGKLGVRAVPATNTGGGGGADWSKWRKDWDPGSVASEMIRLIQASQDYQTVLDSLRAGTIDEAQAAQILGKMRKEALNLLRQQEKLESKLAYAMEHKGAVSNKALTKLIEKLEKVNEQIDQLGGGAGGSSATPEDKIAAITERFRSGEISAADAQKQIDAIKAGGGMGLPGIGDVTGAMDALAGAKGGAAIEALRNLIIEAQQAKMGIGELQEYLEGKGFDVNKLFTKLASEGMDTMDELLRANDASLIDFLATIQQQAPDMVAMLDALLNDDDDEGGDGGGKKGKKGKKGRRKKKSKEMRELAEAMKGIPRNVDATVTIHTKVTGAGKGLIDRLNWGIGK